MQNAVATRWTEPIDTRNWEELLRTGAEEVFEMMIGMPLARHVASGPRSSAGYTAVIGVAGPISGVFAVRCDEKTACRIASGMLGIDESQVSNDVWDALGEVCNMVVGNFKAKTGKCGESSVLSVPTVIHGHEYRVRPLVNGSFVECVMLAAGGELHLRLDYKLA